MTLPEAILALKQGVGRLIRTETDRGVIAILDSRINTKRYGQQIVASLPRARRARSIADVKQFFRTRMSEFTNERMAHIPGPSDRRIALRVTPEAERALRGGHPWLFERAITRQSHAGRAGDLAVIFDRKGRFLAVGLYDPHSTIRARVLQHGEPAAINRDWFATRIAAAAQLRAPLLAQDTTGYRLVHGGNDGLPGLVIDRYDRTLALKLYTSAWLPHLRDVLPALAEVIPAERVVLRLGRAAQEQDDASALRDGMILSGPPLDGPVLFLENGLRFEADPVHGQKTGFFLDQRDNRARVGKLAAGKSVLNIFAYTGGFSLYAARGGARAAVSLDASAPALESAARNFALNHHHPSVAAASHELLAEDAFEGLARLGQERPPL